MFRGIYTAANAMRTKQRRIETIANNLANTDTTGYKKDSHVIEAFSEKLLYKRNDIEGHMRRVVNRVKVDNEVLKDGTNQVTLTLGRGYLNLEDNNGKGQYKEAKLVRDEDGYMRTIYRDYNSKKITKFGSYLLDENGKRVVVDQDGEFSVDNQGNLTVDGSPVAKIIIPEPRKSIGTINGGALTDRVMTNFMQGNQERTENDMHMSLEGDGFFKVRMKGKDKIKYTRSGAFTMDIDGTMMDHLGNKFMSIDGNPIQFPEDSAKIEIGRAGDIYSINTNGNREYIDTLDIVDIENKEDMRKYGKSFFEEIPGRELVETDFEGKLLQGYLETSNVNTVDEMVNMIEMQRGFEADQKVIQTYDQIMQKASNDVGKV